MNKPSDRDHASVAMYFQNDQPLMETDRGWIRHKEDLVTIRGGRENAWLDAAIESVLRWYPCEPIKVNLRKSSILYLSQNEADNSIQMLFCSKVLTPFQPSYPLLTTLRQETRGKSSDESIHYFTRSRINFLVTLILVAIILILLVVPIYILFYLTVALDGKSTDTACIGVLLASTLIFSSVLSLFTKARRHEILAAAAG